MNARLFALAVLGGCTLTPGPAPDYPPLAYPAGDDIVTVYPDDSPEAAVSPCGRACRNVAALGCPEGGKSPGGSTCYQVCSRTITVRRVPVECWAHADSVDHLRACGAEMRCRP